MSWTLIESQTLGSSVASVTLGSGGTIPQTYKTLRLVVSGRSDAATSAVNFHTRPNGATTNLSIRYLDGSGTSTGSGTETTGWSGNVTAATATASTFSNVEISIPNYAGATYKVASIDSVTENDGSQAYQDCIAWLWSNTAAITSLVLVPTSGNFVSGSTFTLYGLK